MQKVILDTNILLVPGEHMIDIFGEISAVMQEPFMFLVVQPTLAELEKLGAAKTKKARAAQLGYALVKTRSEDAPTLFEKLLGLKSSNGLVKIVTASGYADDAITTLAGPDVIVATLDKKLQMRVKKKGSRILSLRGKRFAFVQ